MSGVHIFGVYVGADATGRELHAKNLQSVHYVTFLDEPSDGKMLLSCLVPGRRVPLPRGGAGRGPPGAGEAESRPAAYPHLILAIGHDSSLRACWGRRYFVILV